MRRMRWMKNKNGLLVLLSAFLSALPYTVPALFFLSWFSFVPLILVLMKERGKIRTDLGYAFLFGFFYYLFTYWWFWVLYPMDFAGVSKGEALLIVLLGWAGISLLHGSLFLLVGLAVHFAKKLHRRSFTAAAFLLAFLLCEWITSLSPLAFPWVRLCAGQFRAPLLIQSAAVWGVYGADLLILTVNVFLSFVILSSGRRRLIPAALAVFLFSGNFLFGAIRMGAFEKETNTVRVAAVQGNILSGDKWSDTGFDRCFDTYYGLTENLTEDVDLIVWPETALPVTLNGSSFSHIVEELQLLSEKCGAPILTGAFWKQEKGESNAAVLISPTNVSEPYAKRHLVPFGESVPYRDVLEKVFPFLTDINMLSEDVAAGDNAGLFTTDKGKVGTLICFESIFPELAADSVGQGAHFLAVITNDSWYKDSPAVYQHLSHAVLRSIECGRSTVRAANSGVSALIDPCGRILQELGPLKQGVVIGEIPYSEADTAYSSIGDRILPVYGVVLAVWCGVCLIVKRRRHGGK